MLGPPWLMALRCTTATLHLDDDAGGWKGGNGTKRHDGELGRGGNGLWIFELFGMDGWTDTPSVVFVLSYFSCFKVCRCDVFFKLKDGEKV